MDQKITLLAVNMAKPVWCQYLRGRVRELSLSQYHFALMHFCLCKPSASIRASNIHDISWSYAWANTSKSVIESIQHLFGAITAIWIYQQAVQHSQFGCQEGIGNFRLYFGPVGGICLSMWQLLQTMYGYPVNRFYHYHYHYHYQMYLLTFLNRVNQH